MTFEIVIFLFLFVDDKNGLVEDIINFSLTVTPLAPPPMPGVQLIQQPPPPPVANPPLPTDLPELPPMPARPELPNTAKNKCRMVVLDGSNIAYQ